MEYVFEKLVEGGAEADENQVKENFEFLAEAEEGVEGIERGQEGEHHECLEHLMLAAEGVAVELDGELVAEIQESLAERDLDDDHNC